MKAIVLKPGAKAPRLVWEEVAEVRFGPGEVLVEVRASAVNRADLLQARDRVMALLDGGGCAQRAAANAGLLMRLPQNWSFEQGAGGAGGLADGKPVCRGRPCRGAVRF